MLVLKRVLVVLMSIAAAATVLAAPVAVRLSTVAPPGTTWDTTLHKMGADWAKATDSRVTLRIIPGKSEPQLLSFMRPEVNQLDAALLTAGGLSSIDEGFNVFGIPFFFQSDAEEQAVRAKLEPVLVKRLEAKKFHLLSWGHGGWVQLFSTVPIKTLADVKKAKLFTSSGGTEMTKWYTSNGLNPVQMDAGNIAQGLATGMINATPMPPYGAAVMQVSRSAKYMLDVNVDPLIGALIMTDSTWTKIDAADRDKIVAAAKVMGDTLQTEVPKQDAASVVTMQSKGLTVTKLDAAGAAAFHAEADKLAGTMRGGMVPADIYDLALQARDAFRKSQRK
jgi:TRAP-type C4-dicarboxylate transport system substrate-binding protein